MWRNLVLLMASSALSLGLGFVALETFWYYALHRSDAWHDPLTAFDPELGWSPIANAHRPDWGGVTTNSAGYRSPEIDPSRRPVLLLGDSVAWGYGVADADTPSSHLDRLLSPSGLQVHNLAVSGYDVGQYVLRLERELGRFDDPAWVVVAIYPGNDLRDSRTNTAYGKRKPLYTLDERGRLQLTQVPISRYCLQNLIARSLLLTAMESPEDQHGSVFQWIHAVSTPVRPGLLRLAGNVWLEDEELRSVTRQLLVRAAERAFGRHAGLLLVLSPPGREFSARTREYRWYQELLAELPYPTLDYFDYVTKHHLPAASLYLDRSHFSGEGSERFARAIAERIAPP